MAEPYSHPGSAQVYDAVYAQHHPYAGGAATVLELVRKAGDGRDPKSMSLLDVGCGTGRLWSWCSGWQTATPSRPRRLSI